MSDLTAPDDTPVIVPASSVSPIVMTLLRYALTALGAMFVSKGWLSDGQADELVGLALLIVPPVIGMIATRRNNVVQRTLANKLPDSDAQVK